MGEIESVSDFVNRFLDEAIHKKAGVGWQAVELLLQTVERDDRAGAAHLRFAENKGENGDIEVGAGYPEHAPGAIVGIALHALQKLGGMVLATLGMKGELRIEPCLPNAARDAEGVSERGSQGVQQPRIEISDREQIEHLRHRGAFTWFRRAGSNRTF